jgi:uncharacterized membrane protein YdjX (TVP38/TMEM64 family)
VTLQATGALRFRAMPRRVPPALIWIVVLILAWGAVLLAGVDPVRDPGAWIARAAEGPWVAPALLGAYAARAVVLFPATALALFAGYALGPVWGALIAWLGAVGSAALAYGLARAVRPGRRAAGSAAPAPSAPAPSASRTAQAESGGRGGWRARLSRNAFEAILIARLAAAPGDVVNVTAGGARAPFGPFVAATALGGLPGLLAVVWAGASLEGAFRVQGVAVRPELVAASIAMAVVALGVSAWLRRRSRQGGAGAADE